MCPFDSEIDKIRNQIIDIYKPLDIILFGSCAKGRVSKKSDIDICVIIETNDKRESIRRMLLEIDYEIDLKASV